MMTGKTLFDDYKMLSAATSYIMGFTFEKKLYMVQTSELNPAYFTMEKQSAKNGGTYALRLRFKKDDKAALTESAICLGSESLISDSKYNKGETFEKIVTEYMGQEWKKDNVPFYKAGDISVGGEEIQVKFDGATIINEKTMAHTKEILGLAA